MTIRRAYVDVPHGQIHFRTTGEGPVLVLLHQTAASSRMFEHFMTALARDFTLVALDTPGFGGSDPFPAPPTTSEFVSALHAAVNALGYGRYHLLGHHTGAALACEWAATVPQEVESLGMIGALAMGPDARATWLAGVKDADLQPDGSHLQAAWDRVAGIDSQPVRFPPATALRHREAVYVMIASPRWPEAYRAVFAQDFEAHLTAVTCPVLLMSGEDDVLWPYFEATAALRPDATTAVFSGGAYVLDQSTEETVSVVREFHQSLAGR
jgi:pimeloyl-ACP methyl ester carboxylesterase